MRWEAGFADTDESTAESSATGAAETASFGSHRYGEAFFESLESQRVRIPPYSSGKSGRVNCCSAAVMTFESPFRDFFFDVTAAVIWSVLVG